MKNTSRYVAFAAALSAGALATGVARAQGPLPPGSFIIGAERLTGVAKETTTTEETDAGVTVEQTVDTTSVALLGQGRFSLTALGPGLQPRFGFDGVIGPGVTLGGSLLYARSSGEQESKVSGGGVDSSSDDDSPTISWFVIHPRVGYALALNESFALWPRLGVTYANIGITNETENLDINGMTTTYETESTITMIEASLEVLVAASPVPHTAIIFGPFLDLPIGGGTESERTPPDPNFTPSDEDVSYMAFGLVAGISLVL